MYVCLRHLSVYVCMSQATEHVCIYVCMSQTYIHTYIHTYMLSAHLKRAACFAQFCMYVCMLDFKNPSPCEGFWISMLTQQATSLAELAPNLSPCEDFFHFDTF